MSWDAVFSAVLETPRVRLRPLVPGDRDALAGLVFDPDIWRYFVTWIQDEAGLDRFMESGLADIADGRRAVFVIEEKRSGRLAGSTCFGNLAPAERRIEIGWSWLGQEFRGTGVNRHAKLALLTHAFDALACERVEFKTDVLNLRARQGLRNIGAVEEGVLRSFNYMPDGRRRDAIYYSVLRGEWPEVRAQLAPAPEAEPA